MLYTPMDIANWFLAAVDRDAGDSITHLKLQKLVYYAQAWSLALREQELFVEEFEAWTHGPVLRSLYNEFREHGWQALPPPRDWETEIDEDTVTLLDEVYNVYGAMHAKRLEVLTHSEAPWKDARGNLPPEASSNRKITIPAMRDFYSRLNAEAA